MKVSDIVLQLAQKLPLFSDNFTDVVQLSSLTAAGGVATAISSSPNTLTTGTTLNISGVESPILITSLTRVGTVGTLVTSIDHDFTENIPEYLLVKLSGSTEAEFNGSFTVLTVPNRRTITFEMVDSGATTATGAPQLDNGFPPSGGYNGYKSITVIDDTTFTYSVGTDVTEPGVLTSVRAVSAPRITGSITLERLIESYTKQPPTKYWLFASLGDSTVSKDRNILSDASANALRGGYLRQQLIEQLNLYLVIPCSDQIAGREARDDAEDELIPICKSILFKQFPTGVYDTSGGVLNFVSHGFIAYNTAFYIHGFTFERVINLTFNDSAGPSDDVAFRDIDVSILLQQGTQEDPLLLDINLDDEPLP